jgi:NifU-like protein involved in Fe-S cluster formation
VRTETRGEEVRENAMVYVRGCAVMAISALLLSTQVQAQTVDECMAEIRKMQDYLMDEPGLDSTQAQIASDHLERAELKAHEGNGKECMEYVEQAKGAAG